MIQFIGGVFSFMKHDDFAKKEVSLYAPDIYLFKPSLLFFPFRSSPNPSVFPFEAVFPAGEKNPARSG